MKPIIMDTIEISLITEKMAEIEKEFPLEGNYAMDALVHWPKRWDAVSKILAAGKKRGE